MRGFADLRWRDHLVDAWLRRVGSILAMRVANRRVVYVGIAFIELASIVGCQACLIGSRAIAAKGHRHVAIRIYTIRGAVQNVPLDL